MGHSLSPARMPCRTDADYEATNDSNAAFDASRRRLLAADPCALRLWSLDGIVITAAGRATSWRRRGRSCRQAYCKHGEVVCGLP